MYKLAVAMAVLAAVAFAQERPKISEDFLAVIDVERHDREGLVFGRGFLASDVEAQKAAERYDLDLNSSSGVHRVLHVFMLQRADLHREYQIDSEDMHDCHERDISDRLEAPFAWVEHASYIGEVTHRGVTLQGWQLRTAGVRLLLGVSPNNTNTPVIFERESGSELTRYYFAEFNATRPESKIFDVPEECHKRLNLGATPQRPDITETFTAIFDLESRDRENKAIFGEGFMGHDQAGQRAVERYDLHPREYHNFHVLALERADIHKDYEISSEDARDCHVRERPDPLEPLFAWVKDATYAGVVTHHELTLDAWEYRVGGARVMLGVAAGAPNTPVVLERESSSDFARYFFTQFNATMPPSYIFEIPEECQHNASTF